MHEFDYTIETINNPSISDIEHCFDPQKFTYHYDTQMQEHISFEKQDITARLKEKYIDKLASIVSVNEIVRKKVTHIQRTLASNHNIVIDGRDVGSAVFPNAEIKFFVTASVKVRAQRWKKDQEKYGNHLSFEQAIVAITDRDDRDKNRIIAPLIIPENAIIIDTSDLTIPQAVTIMLTYIESYKVKKGKK